MIFVSSACVRGRSLEEVVGKLAGVGFKYVELSGGIKYRADIKQRVMYLKKKWGLTFLLHNYFPPPKEDFVLNLASEDNWIFLQSIKLIKNAINLSKTIGSSKYGFHSGFYMDIAVSQVGHVLAKSKITNKRQAMGRFCKAFKEIQSKEKKFGLYLENNVVSSSNFEAYGKKNPFMMTTFNEYKQLKEKINFKLLLDVGHLKVSCHTLGINFEKELAAFLAVSDYVHISDNDGKKDSNRPLKAHSRLFGQLKTIGLKGKTISVEVYDSLNAVIKTHDLLERLT